MCLQPSWNLVNTTGSTLSELMIGYHGRVERTVVERSPAWEVEVNGTVIPDLAYSTESGNDVFVYTVPCTEPVDWKMVRNSVSDGLPALVPGSGLHRHIGLSDVVVAVPSTVELAMPGMRAGDVFLALMVWFYGFIQDISPVQGFPGQGFPPMYTQVTTDPRGSRWAWMNRNYRESTAAGEGLSGVCFLTIT